MMVSEIRQRGTMKNSRMIIPPTRAEAAADELRRRILEGEYKGGMQLRQAAISEELGISRIPFREALVQLEAEGLVQMTPHKGAVVAEISIEDVQEHFEFRALLEPTLLALSAPKLSLGDFAKLHAILKEYSDELRNSHVNRWGELNTQLHALLLGHANRKRMLSIAMQLLQSTDRFTRMQLLYTDGRTRAEQDHGEIVRLCEAGDVKGACRALRTHIVNAGEVLIQLLKKKQTLLLSEAS
jgi:DNA-binding GntR family transcriptional regulator